MGMRHIQQSYIEHDSPTSQPLSDNLWYLARSCSDFQQRKSLYSRRLSHMIYHFLRGCDPAKPAVDPPQDG